MSNLLLIAGNNSHIFKNLIYSLTRKGYSITLLKFKNKPMSIDVWKFNKSVKIKALDQNMVISQELITEIRSNKYDFILWDEDVVMKIFSQDYSNVELWNLILPIRNQNFRKMLGSKIGQAEVFDELDIRQPRYEVLFSNFELNNKSKNQFDHYLLKGDSFAGGDAIMEVTNLSESEKLVVPEIWFPVLRQEFILGETISIDAIYKDGQLVAWCYSLTLTESHRFGPSIVRKYISPKDKKFVKDLVKIGQQSQLNGFVNITYIKSFKDNQLYLIEFDTRPNVWHHMLFEFGFQPNNNQTTKLNSSKFGPDYSLIYEPFRLFSKSLSEFRLLLSLKILLKRKIPGYGVPAPSAFYSKYFFPKSCLKLLFSPLLIFRALLIRNLSSLLTR